MPNRKKLGEMQKIPTVERPKSLDVWKVGGPDFVGFRNLVQAWKLPQFFGVLLQVSCLMLTLQYQSFDR